MQWEYRIDFTPDFGKEMGDNIIFDCKTFPSNSSYIDNHRNPVFDSSFFSIFFRLGNTFPILELSYNRSKPISPLRIFYKIPNQI